MAIYLPQDQVVVGFNETTGAETMAPAFTYGANVIDNGGAYQGAYVSFDGEMIQLGGVIRTTASLAVGAVLIKLNAVLAPRANEVTQIEINGVSYPAEIDVNGTVTTKVAIGPSGTVGLNSIRFLSKEVYVVNEVPVPDEPVINPLFGEIHAFTAGELLNGAAIYGSTWEVPGYRVGFDGVVTLFGMLSLPTTPNGLTLFKLPVEIAPLKQRVFTCQVDGHTVQARLDIQQNGNAVIRCLGLTNPNYLSLEGVSFFINPLAV